MKRFKFIGILIVMGLLLLPSGRCRAEESTSEGIDVGEILFGHTGIHMDGTY